MNLVTNSWNPPKVDGKLVLIEEAYSCLRAYLTSAVVPRITGLKAYREGSSGGGSALTERCRWGIASIVYWSRWDGCSSKHA